MNVSGGEVPQIKIEVQLHEVETNVRRAKIDSTFAILIS